MSDLAWLESFHGFLLVDKPGGITSQDVITRLQHALMKRSDGRLKKKALPSMGHGGTLDPFATGLLVVAVGDGVKLTRYLLGSDKTYEADVAFGARTASGDLTNEVIARTERLPENEDGLARAAVTFLGAPYLQLPPMYSAKKIDGIPLYEHARKGIDVERAKTACTVRELAITGVTPAPGGGLASARFRTTVSSGTFIRTLAEDLAGRAGSLAHLTALRRLGSGSIALADAATLELLAEGLDQGRAWSDLPCFRPFHRAVLDILPRLVVDEAIARRIFSGEVKTLGNLSLPHPGSIALYCHNKLVAIVRDADSVLGTARTIERGFPLRFTDGVPMDA